MKDLWKSLGLFAGMLFLFWLMFIGLLAAIPIIEHGIRKLVGVLG